MQIFNALLVLFSGVFFFSKRVTFFSFTFQKSITPLSSDNEPAPMDLSKKSETETGDRKNIFEDKSSLLFEPSEILQRHQQV